MENSTSANRLNMCTAWIKENFLYFLDLWASQAESSEFLEALNPFAEARRKKKNSWRVSKIELDWISSGSCSTLAFFTCYGSFPSYFINEKMAKKYLQVFSKQTLLHWRCAIMH